jgi:hypothetical protein
MKTSKKLLLGMLRTPVQFRKFFMTQKLDMQMNTKICRICVLTAVVIKNSIFWDITPCVPFKANRHFGGIRLLNLQGQRISQARNQLEAGSR